MTPETASQIINSPEFRELQSKRRRIVIPLALIILATYFGFILTIAFDPSYLGQAVGSGVTSLGIYAGIALLLLSFTIVGVYIRLTSGDIKTLLSQIRHKAG